MRKATLSRAEAARPFNRPTEGSRPASGGSFFHAQAGETARRPQSPMMADTVKDIVERGAEAWGLALSDAQLAAFARYAELLTEWNATKFNLTRLTSPPDIAVKHFLDSLSILTVADIAPGARIIDVGTGAGLPGLALAIARSNVRVTLLDSTLKKLTFCRAVADELHLDVDIIHARAEDAARLPAHAAQYDYAVARAVAPLDRLLPWLAPFVKPGGQLIMLKGPNVEEELGAARPVARHLGVMLLTPVTVTLPDAGEPVSHRIVVGRKPPSPQ